MEESERDALYEWRPLTLYESIVWEGGDLDQWGRDLSAGRLPDYWKKQSISTPRAPSGAASMSQPTAVGNWSLSREIGFLLTQLQYPLCMQMLGCVLTIPILRRRPRAFEGLSQRAVSWFSTFGILCILECALLLVWFWGRLHFGLYQTFPVVFIQGIHALAVMTVLWVLWEIRRAFREETTAGRATLLLRGSLVYVAVFFFLKTALTYKTGSSPDLIYFMGVFVIPLSLAILIGIVLSVSWELVQWTKHHGPLPLRTKFCLYLAAPLLGAQAVTTSWPLFFALSLGQPWAVSLLWLNVLLPWLMICAFTATEKLAEKPGTSQLAAVP